MKSNYHARDKNNNTSIYVETNGQTVITVTIYSDDGCHTISIPPQRVMHEPGIGVNYLSED